MEIEYKWEMPDVSLAEKVLACPEVADHISVHETIHMRATYYDTPDTRVRDMGGGLRIRQENDESICCLKLAEFGPDGCKTRREYEVNAEDIQDGLRLLVQNGAPEDVCEMLLASSPAPICGTDFIRQAYKIEADDFVAELAIDEGNLLREDRRAPISEIELEYVDGSLEVFHAFAKSLEDALSLKVLPLSKLARAVTL